MTRVLWLTDIHLNFLRPLQFEKFCQQINSAEPDCIVISGDIGEAPRLKYYLQRFEKHLPFPMYFVLGNHDYYGASFEDAAQLITDVTANSQLLHWLTSGEIVQLSEQVGLIGHDGWADGRYGNYENSQVMLNDYLAIRDFVGMTKPQRLGLLNQLGDAAAQYVLEVLPKALARYDHVYFVTHVPPFREACIHDDNWLPHYASKAVGEALVQVMCEHPVKVLTVLCGHTHTRKQIQVLDNLYVMVGGAEYSHPEIQYVFDV